MGGCEWITKISTDDYLTRREHLKDLSDEALKATFGTWPKKSLILGRFGLPPYNPASNAQYCCVWVFPVWRQTNRAKTIEHDLIGKGAGHVVYRYSRLANLPLRDAGLALMENQGWDLVKQSFGGRHA